MDWLEIRQENSTLFQVHDLCHEIAQAIATDKSWDQKAIRTALIGLACISRVSHVSARNMLWRDLPSLTPLLMLLPTAICDEEGRVVSLNGHKMRLL